MLTRRKKFMSKIQLLFESSAAAKDSDFFNLNKLEFASLTFENLKVGTLKIRFKETHLILLLYFFLFIYIEINFDLQYKTFFFQKLFSL